MKWLFTLEHNYTYNLRPLLTPKQWTQWQSDVPKSLDFYDDAPKPRKWLTLQPNGNAIVYKGYSWDGNSPKFNILDFFWLGTPDGIRHANKPVTYYASLLHDILGQFKHHPNMPTLFRAKGRDLWENKGRQGRDLVYYRTLEKAQFLWRGVYVRFVFLCGPFYDAYLQHFKQVKSLKCPSAQ